MDWKLVILFTSILLLILPSQISIAQEDNTTEFMITYHDYSPGDYFEYSGYTTSLFKSINETYSVDETYIGATASHMLDMRMSVSGSTDCEIGTYNGPCEYSTLRHELNITLKWEPGSSNYLNDTLDLLIETTVKDYKSDSTEMEKRIRTIHLKSWFSTEYGEEQYLEDKAEEVLTINRIGDRPNTVSVGDAWSISELIAINETHSTRSNRGPWTTLTHNSTSERQLSFQAERYEVVDISTGVHPTILVTEHVFMTESDSKVWLGEYGYPLKIEEYDNETLILSAELVEYRYLKVDDPSASTSIHWSGICFGILFVAGVLFVVGFTSFNVWHSRKNLERMEDFNVGELNELLAVGISRNEDVDSTTMKGDTENVSDRDERISKLMERYTEND